MAKPEHFTTFLAISIQSSLLPLGELRGIVTPVRSFTVVTLLQRTYCHYGEIKPFFPTTVLVQFCSWRGFFFHLRATMLTPADPVAAHLFYWRRTGGTYYVRRGERKSTFDDLLLASLRPKLLRSKEGGVPIVAGTYCSSTYGLSPSSENTD